jgi:hypothetical protein
VALWRRCVERERGPEPPQAAPLRHYADDDRFELTPAGEAYLDRLAATVA